MIASVLKSCAKIRRYSLHYLMLRQVWVFSLGLPISVSIHFTTFSLISSRFSGQDYDASAWFSLFEDGSSLVDQSMVIYFVDILVLASENDDLLVCSEEKPASTWDNSAVLIRNPLF